jgi:hypothetical protein
MKITYLFCFILLMLFSSAYSNSSDFNFRPMHEKIHYKEDFFRLYNQWLYQDLDSISRNIYFLELAYVVPYDHPIKALTVITNEIQYEHYKNMLMMHICVMLAQEYINYGQMYVKDHLYFFNEEFKKEYQDGYDIAEFYFNCSRRYWVEAVDFAKKADAVLGYRTSLQYMEDEIYRIKTLDLNYDKVIDTIMAKINKNRQEIVRMWGK